MDSSIPAAPATAVLSAPPAPYVPAAPHDRAWVWFALLLALSFGAAFVSLRDFIAQVVGAVVLTGVYTWLVLRFCSALARRFCDVDASVRNQALLQAILLCLASVGAWAASEFVVKPLLQRTFAEFGNQPPSSLQYLGMLNYNLRPLLLVLAAASGGVALSRMIKYPNMLGPLAGVAALVDVWGVLLGGIVSQLLASKKAAPIAERAMAKMPTLGGAGSGGAGGEGTGITLGSIGAGDFLFLGLFFGVLWAHRMDVRASVNWMWPLVTLALCAIILGAIAHLPGLLFIGLGALVPNTRFVRFTREEKFALVYAVGFVVLLTAALYFAITSQL
jgi:hypothetical protein